MKSGQYKDNKCPNNDTSRGNSIILAGYLTKEQYALPSDLNQINEESCNIECSNKQRPLRDTSNILSETSYLSLAPDLNKCINLFDNKHLRKDCTCEKYSSISSTSSEVKEDSENIDPCHSDKSNFKIQYNIFNIYPRASSENSLKSDEPLCEKKIRKSKSCTTLDDKKDTDHNFKAKPFLLTQDTNSVTKTSSNDAEKVTSLFDALTLSESSSNKKDNSQLNMEKSDEIYYSLNGESTKEELNSADLKTVLQSLEEKTSKDETTQQRLKRLSITFYNSPRTFTERLLTIIEESVINSSDTFEEFPEISLCRLTDELRKMCKFIDNETAPEWPTSPNVLVTSTCAKEENRKPKFDPSRKSTFLDGSSSPSKDSHLLAATPTVGARLNFKSPKKALCTPKNMSGVFPMNSPMCDNSAHDSTKTFEMFEKYCENLYSDKYKISAKQENRASLLRNKNRMLRAYDDQMASLEDSPVHEKPKNPATPIRDLTNRPGALLKAQNMQRSSVYKKCNKDTKFTPRTPERSTERVKSHENFKLDELENTLMYEIAKKRQRCLDTAKMAEIDATPESAEAQSMSVSGTSSSSNDNTQLMEMLISCKRYQDYLQERKPLLTLLKRAELRESSSSRGKKDVRTPDTKTGVATLSVPKLSATKKRSTSPSPRRRSTSNKVVVTKPRLFVTPGKTPTNRTACKGKRTYFPNLVDTPGKLKELNGSPHARSIYRQMGLNYDSIVSPVGMYIRGTDPHLTKNLRPKTDEMLLTPRRTPSKNQKPEMKFKLSPRRPKEVRKC